MLELPYLFMQWMRSGLGLLLIACIYLAGVSIVIALAALAFLRGYLHFRHPQHVLCPVTGEGADLRVVPSRAAVAHLFHEREFRIKSCTAADCAHCDHACISQLG